MQARWFNSQTNLTIPRSNSKWDTMWSDFYATISLSLSGLVVFVIILPACCTAIYHYVSYKKGWDDEDPECDDSACSECNVQMGQESEEEIQFRLGL